MFYGYLKENYQERIFWTKNAESLFCLIRKPTIINSQPKRKLIYRNFTNSSVEFQNVMTNKVSRLIQTDKQLNQLYTLKEKRGNGCFGQIYDCVENKTYRQTVLKIEMITPDQNQLTLEREYILLRRLQHIEGIPKVYAFYQSLRLNFIEMERLSLDLEKYIQTKKDITAEEVCDIGCQVIQILKGVHQAGVVHRDIKPQNIMMDEREKIYLIDYGISSKTNQNQARAKRSIRNGQFIGTPRYASLAAHEGRQIKPKDDIESLLYVLIYATKQKLPWITGKQTKHKVQQIGLAKKRLSKKQICKSMPMCYLSTFEYLHSLGTEKPLDHDTIIEFFKTQKQPEDALNTVQTIGQFQKTMKSDDDKSKIKRPSLQGFLTLPKDENGSQNCVHSNRVLIEFITRVYFDEEDDNMSIEEQIKNGQPSLANRFGELLPVNPRLKLVVDSSFKDSRIFSAKT